MLTPPPYGGRLARPGSLPPRALGEALRRGAEKLRGGWLPEPRHTLLMDLRMKLSLALGAGGMIDRTTLVR